jgi:hypothetical protein
MHGTVSESLIALTLDTVGVLNSRTAGLTSLDTEREGAGDAGAGEVSPNMDGDAEGDALSSDRSSACFPLRRESARISGILTSKTAAAAITA